MVIFFAVLKIFFQPFITEDSENRFQVVVKGIKPGTTQIKVSVKQSSPSKMHFIKGDTYEDQITITIYDSPKISDPLIIQQNIRLALGSEVVLRSNRLVY